LATRLVGSADFVCRRSVRENMGDVDLNRWSAAQGPVIRACQGPELLDPTGQCPSGPITVQMSGGLASYKGLLVKLERRWAGRHQMLGSYALSSNRGFNGVIDNDD
jgi:hypothetical protein